MKRVGFIGLGDMGSAMASNAIKAGFNVVGFDLDEKRQAAFVEIGGKPVTNAREVGEKSDAAFVMVLNGKQAKSAILGHDGLVKGLQPGSIVLLSATIKPSEAREIAQSLQGTGIEMIDTPVSGGQAGAIAGTLTMMAAAKKEIFDANQDVLTAVGGRIFHVGEEPGMGQTVKAALQALIGSIFAATFEAAALAAKSGVEGKILHDVFTASGASCQIVNNSLQKILDRTFIGTGSHIGTMYKDLTISMEQALEQGVPMFTAAAAMQLFQAGKTRFPEEDNWAVVKVLEEITGTKVIW